MVALPRLGIRARLALLVIATTAPFVVLSVVSARRDSRQNEADRLLERVTLAASRIFAR
jgi:hypothetical protein